MFRPLPLFIGLRYTRAKRRNSFISFISMMSMIGIALGIIVLITVLSVMNGFDREIKKRVFGMVPPLTVTSTVGYVANWQDVENRIRKYPNITVVAPVVTQQVMLTNSGYVQPAMVNGILPEQEKNISVLADKMIEGSLHSLKPGQFNIVLGEDLADRLEANIGDKITVVTPQVSLSAAGVIPRFKRFTVTGIFRAGSGFGFDMSFAFINLSDSQKLFEMGPAVTALRAGVKNVFAAPLMAEGLSAYLGPEARVMNWTDQFGPFFHAVKLEKTMMFFILLLIIAVAVFNLVSTLVMVVNDKEADIAILRTFGATPKMVMQIFIIQGTLIGVTGTLLGVIGGILLARNVTEIVNWIQSVFHVQFLSSSVYFVNYLPSEIQAMDILYISFSALFLSLIATIYPAWRASRTEPVEALRYE
jgi:lipoprotein-releasing system permease protein